MSELNEKIAILRHREERLRTAQDGLKSLGAQRLEAIQAGEMDRAKAMDAALESHRQDITRLPSLIAKLRDELNRDHPGWNNK
ncbi:MAG TPA: hypothetical protein VGH23_12715 [Rhizomicrobium sp.]|jgi:hypothetical protein